MKKHLTWNTMTTAIRTGLSLLRYLLIARYLSPREFGLFALSKGLVDSFFLLKCLSSNGSLIIFDVKDAQRGSLYVFDLLLGVLVYSLLFQAAPRLAWWYAEPALISWLRLIGLIICMTSLTEQWFLLLQKEMSWQFLGLLRVAAFASGIVVLYVTQSLIWETLVQYGVSVLVVGIVGLRRFPLSLRFSGVDLRVALSFGCNEIARSIVSQLTGQVSHLLLTRTFGTETLGLFSLAYKLAYQGTTRLSPILTTLALPALSRSRRKLSLLARMFGLLVIMNLACSLVVIVAGPLLLRMLFGDAWLTVGPLAQVLAIGAFFHGISAVFPNYLLSLHHLQRVFVVTHIIQCVNILAVIIGCSIGRLDVLIWLTVVQAIIAVLCWILAIPNIIRIALAQVRKMRLCQIVPSGNAARHG